MRSVLFLAVALLALGLSSFKCEQQAQQQVGARILRRVIKSTPTASNLARVRLVTVRSASSSAERGAVSEISSKEAANFGQRSSNETSQVQAAAKSARPTGSPASTSTSSSSSSSTSTPSTTTTSAPTSSQQPAKASERQQAALVGNESVEVLASAPSSWQMMSAVEAPAAAALIAAGTRPVPAGDLSSSPSEELSQSTSDDFLRSSASKTSFSQSNTVGETFSRLRQGKTAQQQSFFYPQQQQQRTQSKTSGSQATKTHWYQPSTSTSSTTARPAPIVEQQRYEQQSEQYVEAAPPGQAEPFAFDFNTQDNSGNGQYRKEESDSNGVVRGSYGYTDANGIYRHVEYVADHNGFRANIKSNEPGLIGETEPASISLDSGSGAPQATSQRLSTSSLTDSTSSSNSQWTALSGNERADLALAPPDFESSHKAERIRAPRNYRN